MTIAGTRLTWDGVNLLTENQSSLETGVTGWAADANCSVAQSSTLAQHGAFSLRLSSTGAGDMTAATPTGLAGIPVIPNKVYSCGASCRAGSVGRSTRLLLRWYDATGTLISTVTGSTVISVTGSWTVCVVSGAAPANAAFMALMPRVLATAGAGELHYFDQLWVSPGARAVWTFGQGDTFDRWELERDDSTLGYLPIANITDPHTFVFDDYEGRLGVAASYRLRWKRDDGSVSEYGTPAVGPIPAASGCMYDLTGNWVATTLYRQHDDGSEGEREYDFHDEPVIMRFFDTDGSASFRPSEDGLDSFTIDLELYVSPTQEVPAAKKGRAAFDALLALVREPAPYVCVRDSDGGRWFAELVVRSGRRSEPMGEYAAPVEVIELTRAPATVGIEADE